MSKHSATMDDVARACGVTKMTVSYALSGKRRISPETVRRVQEAARQLSYEPNLQARTLASGRGQGVALFSMYLLPGGSARIIEKLQRGLNSLGFDAPLHGFGAHDWQNNPARQVELVRALVGSRPRAVICNNTALCPDALDEFEKFIASGGTLICFGHESDLSCDQVLPNYAGMLQLATEYLIELGHRDIGLYDPGHANPNDPASTGFYRALSEAGLKVNPKWIFTGPIYEEGGVFLAEQFLAMTKHPTAIVSVMDATASVFIQQVERAGWKVPDDISIIGMNDMPASKFWRPTLTAMHQPFDELAQHVVQLLERRLAGDDAPPQRVRLMGHLVPRESTSVLNSKKAIAENRP